MLATLISKELAETLGSTKFRTGAVSCLVLFLISGSLLILDFDHQMAEYNTKRLVHQKLIEQEGKDLMGYGLVQDLPLTPLQCFFPGAQGRISKAVSFTLSYEPEQVGSVEGLKVEKLFPTFSLTFLFTILMPLVAALLAHGLICREKQQGTLRLIMANSVPRSYLVWAKWLGGFLPLFLILSVCSLGVLVEIRLMARNFSLAGQESQLLLIFLTAVLLLSVFFTFGLMVSSLCHHSANALVGTLAGWLAFSFLVPSLGAYLAETWSPLPSVHEITNQKLQIARNYDEKEHAISHMRLEEWGPYLEKIGKEMDEEHRKLDEWFAQQLSNQVRLARHLTLISPVSAGTYLLTDLVGTGINKEQVLVQALRRYWEQFKHFHIVEIGRRTVDPQWYASHLPPFRVSIGSEIGLHYFALLVLFNILFSIITHRAFLRYEVV